MNCRPSRRWSISAAAKQLGQTASGVSRALGKLEEKLEVTLLRRCTRRVEQTEDGVAFLAQARRILANWLRVNAASNWS
ncbi:HTH-type transcriptional regulator DmlR [compost metagenome]